MAHYSPYSSQPEETGLALRGFYEEYQLIRDGVIDFEEEFLPAIQLFFRSYHKRIHSWREFLNAYRHFIGITYVYPQETYQGAVIEGFRFDFDLFYDPCWLAVNDLEFNCPRMPPLSTEQIFWRAFLGFVESYQLEGPLDPHHFSQQWHRFLEISAVCYNSTAKSGEYAQVGVQSYEEVYRHFLPEEALQKDYPLRLREFVEERFKEQGYFLPSHHFELWVQAMEEDHQELLEEGEAPLSS